MSEQPVANGQEAPKAEGGAKDTVRGLIGNGVALALLFGLSRATGREVMAALALGIQWAVYLVHGLPNLSEKFYDASGSATYLALVLHALTGQREHGPRQLVSAVLVVIWFSRLGSFLFARILKDGRDDRFTSLKRNPMRFLAAWTIQALWVWLVALPVLLTVTSPAAAGRLGVLDLLGWSMWTAGFLIEVIADAQKASFREKPENKGKFINEGLWAYSRHPNYFGEIMMWVGLCVSGSSCFAGTEWLGWLSPVFTYFLLTRVSGVPMLEKKGEKTWGKQEDYQHYMKHTPCIVPALARPPVYKP